ncbi:MAG: hypothetical protein HKN68_17680, partial [Saprospiraceae bacterium]|nr:hypothetical protein [Saprospiraceae bacterium]
TYTYVYYEPVYSTTQEVREGFKIEEPEEMENPGKIYLYGQYILINEPGKGVHVINNIDKENPINEKFIAIPGNHDMAVKDNILYADSYIDLVSIDISDLNNIRLVNRLENAFPNYNTEFGFVAAEGMVITEWEEIETVEISDDCTSGGGNVVSLGGVFMAMEDAAFSAAPSSGPVAPVGQGGSMARFAVYDNYLYAVDSWDLNVFDITNVASPQFENKTYVSWNVETIWPYKDNLFIGSESGMFIFDNSNPSLPQYRSSFMHVTACDPVVVNDDYAFVTLRSGTRCEGFTNQLDVINIENLNSPWLVKTYPMQNPHGLGIDGNTLFICEGEYGLKVYDISDVDAISENLLEHFEGIHSFDVIPYEKVLLMIGEDGLYQYDYSDLGDIKLLSFMVVTGGEI